MNAAVEFDATAGDAWPCPCTELVSVTERCALAAGRYLGRGDARGADEAATEAMVDALGRLRLDGHVVIGRPEADHPLTEGSHLGGGGESSSNSPAIRSKAGRCSRAASRERFRFWPPRFRVG